MENKLIRIEDKKPEPEDKVLVQMDGDLYFGFYVETSPGKYTWQIKGMPENSHLDKNKIYGWMPLPKTLKTDPYIPQKLNFINGIHKPDWMKEKYG